MLTWLLVIEVEVLNCRFIFTFSTTLPPIKAPENMPKRMEFAKLDRSLTWGTRGVSSEGLGGECLGAGKERVVLGIGLEVGGGQGLVNLYILWWGLDSIITNDFLHFSSLL